MQLQHPFSEGSKDQLLSGNGIHLLVTLLYFKDIQHKFQVNLDVYVSVTSEKSTARLNWWSHQSFIKAGPRCSSSGPFRSMGNNRIHQLKNGARKLAHSSEKHIKEHRNSTAAWKVRGTGRSKGKTCYYERSLCKQCYPTVTSISASVPGSAL